MKFMLVAVAATTGVPHVLACEKLSLKIYCWYFARAAHMRSVCNTILLSFKIRNFGIIRFVGNLIGDIHWNFYDDDDVIIVL